MAACKKINRKVHFGDITAWPQPCSHVLGDTGMWGHGPASAAPSPPKDGFNNELGSITGIIREVTAVQEPSCRSLLGMFCSWSSDPKGQQGHATVSVLGWVVGFFFFVISFLPRSTCCMPYPGLNEGHGAPSTWGQQNLIH